MRTLPISTPTTRLSGRVEHIACTARLAEVTLHINGSRLAVLVRRAEIPPHLERGSQAGVEIRSGSVLLDGARALYAIWIRDDAPNSRPLAA